MKQRAIILMNLGSPDSPEVKDVRRYLTEFLMDEKVIDSPYLIRSLVVKGIIVPFRARKSAEAYNSIWTEAGSPLIVLTKELKEKLQANFDEPIEIAMRYGNPSSEHALRKLHKENPDLEEIILLPLYPHYAMSSYETAIKDIKSVHKKKKYGSRLVIIKPFYNNDFYIHALSESIKPFIENDFDKILFSYHGLPERHIKKSDITGCHCLNVNDCCQVPSPAHQFCYRHQTTATTELVVEKLNIPKEKVEQTFQSRLGKDPWLTPYTALRLTELPREGIKKLLVVCPAFVSDCLETLEEMAIQGKESFLEAGGESFTLVPCMNIQPQWIETVTSWLKAYMAGDKEMLFDHTI
jgi:ferrochelatase